jgi:hypothetical protein
MADFVVLDTAPPYHTVRVQIGGAEYLQLLTSAHSGEALTQQLQAYADEYERELVSLT